MKAHWPEVSLGAVLSISAERIEPSEHPATLFNYVGLEHIQGHTGRALPRGETYGSEIASTKNVFHPGQVLYGKLRPYLNKVHLADRDGICSTDIYVLQCENGITLPAFVAYFLRSPLVLNRINDLMQGANLPRLSPTSLKGIPMPLPPMPEQERIVSLLDAAEDLRGLRAAADRRSADLIPGLFYDTFGDPALNPKGWPTASLGDLIADGPQNGLYKHSSAYGEGTRILRIDGFYGGFIDDLRSLKRLRLTHEEADKYRLRPGDIVINRVNSPEYLGKSALIPSTDEPIVFESNMMRFGLKHDRVDPFFLILHLQTRAVKRQIAAKAKHAIHQSSINQDDVKSLVVLRPPLTLQQRFAARVAKVRALESHQAASRDRLDDLFQSMLQRAFRGEL